MGSGMTEAEQSHVDEAEERWLKELAEHCRCCPICWQVPCAGCMQGGICDMMGCECENDY